MNQEVNFASAAGPAHPNRTQMNSWSRRPSTTMFPTPGEDHGPAHQGHEHPARPRAGLLPGVAAACLAIKDDPLEAANLTSRGNLVAVISNGTAVLAWAISVRWPASPSWKARAACSASSLASTCSTSRSTRPIRTSSSTSSPLSSRPSAASTWRTSRRRNASSSRRSCASMKIPVFHDDQHGTAIVAAAASQRPAGGRQAHRGRQARLLGSRRGRHRLSQSPGRPRLRKENILVTDSKGVVYEGRTEAMDEQKAQYARRHRPDLGGHRRRCRHLPRALRRQCPQARNGEDHGGEALILALANPTRRSGRSAKGRPDAIIATGRSDYPTRSTTSSASRSSSAAPSMWAPARSMRR